MVGFGGGTTSEGPGRPHSRTTSVSMTSWSRLSERSSSSCGRSPPSASSLTSSSVASTPSPSAHECYAFTSVEDGTSVDSRQGLRISEGPDTPPRTAEIGHTADGGRTALSTDRSGRSPECSGVADALRMVRQAFSSAGTGASRSQYPPSPSLLRPYPSIRHGPAPKISHRRIYRLIGALALLMTVLGVAAMQNPARVQSSAQAVRAYLVPGAKISPKPFERAVAIAELLPGAARDATNATGTGAGISFANEAEAKAQQAINSAVAKYARRKGRKKGPNYARLLPLGALPRRYRYGANFIVTADDTEAQTTVTSAERTNGRTKMPMQKQLERLYETGRKKYVSEESDWRAFEWTAPPPHSSLARFVGKLKPEELQLRRWIQTLHKQPTARGVGLGARHEQQDAVAPLGPLPVFDRGDRVKWTDLAAQAEIGHAGKCHGSTWLDDYRKLHAEMLSGKREPRFISYHCEQGMNCGGLGDRLLGMTSAFFFGLVTERAFLAEWQSPIPLDVIFDSPHVDWSHSTFVSDQHPVLGQKPLVEAAADLDIIHFDRFAIDATFGATSWNADRDRPLTPGFELRDLAYRSPWIKFFSNRGMVHRAFKYQHLQKRIGELGLREQTAFSCLSDYLFKPKPAALDLITQYTSVMALPTVFSVGIHIRTGDLSMKDSEYDKVNTVKRHISFFRCARELGETYARPDQRVVFYLVTDSQHLKDDAQKVLAHKLITTDFAPQHVHQKSGHVDGVMSAVVEDYVLAKADMLVATQDSGFGKLASFMMAKPNATVTIFPKYNPDVLGLRNSRSHVDVDCTSPTVFTSYEELSSEWSLG